MANLLEIIGTDTTLKRVASTSGGEYTGPCPWCGGRDRFHVWPEHPKNETGRWWCRGCERSGDGPGYLMQRDGLSYPQARDALGLPTSPARRPRSATPAEASRALVAEDEAPPPEEWQEKARAFATWAQEQLWSDAGDKARAYLTETRGLDAATIAAAGLGYNPTCRYRQASTWGIEGNKVYLSRGIVIPCEADGVMWYVQIRRPTAGDALHQYIGDPLPKWKPETKYMAARGGAGKALYLADYLRGNGRPLLWCEGEFDSLLAYQELNDLADVATLGGAAKANQGLPGRWLFRLSPYPVILAAFDRDAAGDAGAERLAKLSPRIRPVKVPHGGDLTDFHQAGGDLRLWLQNYLPAIEQNDPGPVASDPTPDAGTAETVNLAELLDETATRSLEKPCPICGALDWWQRPAERGGGWLCGGCHPAPIAAHAGAAIGAHKITTK